MPLQRRLPKRGFHNKFKVEFAIVSLAQLNQFDSGSIVNADMLVRAGMAKKDQLIKVLANGELAHALTLKVDKISTGAKAMIEAVGGKIIEVE